MPVGIHHGARCKLVRRKAALCQTQVPKYLSTDKPNTAPCEVMPRYRHICGEVMGNVRKTHPSPRPAPGTVTSGVRVIVDLDGPGCENEGYWADIPNRSS